MKCLKGLFENALSQQTLVTGVGRVILWPNLCPEGRVWTRPLVVAGKLETCRSSSQAEVLEAGCLHSLACRGRVLGLSLREDQPQTAFNPMQAGRNRVQLSSEHFSWMSRAAVLSLPDAATR